MISRYSINISLNDLWLAFKNSVMSKKTSDNFEASEDFQFTYNGRSALKILLKDYGAKENDIVIAPLITCKSVHEAISDSDCRLEFVIPKDNVFYPSPLDYSKVINKFKAKFVIVVSSWGYPYPLAELKKIIPKETIIIQDCALSFGSLRNGLSDGSDAHGQIYSFSNGKPLFAFGGGLLKKNIKSENNTIITPLENKLLNIVKILKLYLKSLIINNASLLKIFYSHSKNRKAIVKSSFLENSLPWVSVLYQNKRSEVLKKIDKRKEKYNYMVQLLIDPKIHLIKIEDEVDWNYWMIPIHINSATKTRFICKKLNVLGFDVVEPYKNEIKNFINEGENKKTHRIPKIILTPSLDLMTKEMINEFTYRLKEII